MTDNTIIIDLSSSNHNRPVSKGSELIQSQAFDYLQRKLDEDINQSSSAIQTKAADDFEEEVYPAGSGLTYFIDGTRGAGKSTFLHFAFQQLAAPTHVHKLMYLDPSRIESSENILLHVLKQLRRLAQDFSGRSRLHEEQMERFRRLFQEIAGGLHLFVSNDDALKNLDAELFLDYGLDRAADSQRLRSLLHQIIDLVCEMYKVKVLLFAIDDADTKAEMAVQVLECIRKYLDTPRMVILVTGDLEMYSLLVQNHFQRDFASEDKGLNSDRKRQQTRMVEHLEDQYLLKLFPIQRRIQLKTLHTLIEKHSYQVVVPDAKNTMSLNEAIDSIAAEGLRLRVSGDKRIFREHILKLPVRSVLQLLASYFKPSQGVTPNGRERASEALRATALSSLYRYDVDVESIAEGDLHATIEAAFDLSLLDGDPDTAAYLRPQVRALSLRNSYVSLSADVARLCEQNPAKAITYLLATAGSSSIFRLVEKSQGSGNPRANDGNTDDLQRKVKKYLSVGRTENALNWSWHATAAFIGATTSTSWVLRQGIVGVRTGKKGGAKTIVGQLEEVLTRKKGETYPAIAFSQSGVKQYGNTQRYLSIFNTLGLIANLLELDNSEDNKRQDNIRMQLNKVLAIPTVSLPNWKDLVVAENSDEDIPDDSTEDDESDHINDDENAIQQMVIKIDKWLYICHDLKKSFNPSAVLLGKIWNRLYFSLDNISAYARSGKLTANRCAKTMELFAWALINACLVEEFDYHHRDSNESGGSIDRKNPHTSGEPVISKFKNITPSATPLTYMIATCPLILGLIKRNSKGGNSSKPVTFVKTLNTHFNEDYLKDDQSNSLCEDDAWELIGSIAVAQAYANAKDISKDEREKPSGTKSSRSSSIAKVTIE